MDTKLSDRFDLEQDIVQCWSVIDDIRRICKDREFVDTDDIKSITDYYDLRFNMLWETFTNMVANKGFND